MDSKSFIQRLAQISGENNQQTARMLDCLTAVMRDALTAQKTVAIPSFGSFSAVKHDEIINTDLSTGKRMLLPPQISLEFSPAAMLRKKLNSHE